MQFPKSEFQSVLIHFTAKLSLTICILVKQATMPTSALTIHGHCISSASIITTVWELFPLQFEETIKDTCLGGERNEGYFAHEVRRRKEIRS